MKRTHKYFEIRALSDTYGLPRTFETKEQALAEINHSYEHAKTLGYDNRENKWLVVYVESERETNSDGEFMGQTINRKVIDRAEFSEQENKFVFTK